MAQPWTSPAVPGEGDQPVKAFDRQALEATLADALRDAEGGTVEPDDGGPAPTPVPAAAGRPAPAIRPPAAVRPPAVPGLSPAGHPPAGGPHPAPRPTLLGSGLSGPGGPLGGGTLGSSPLAPPGSGPAPLRRPDGAAPTPVAAPRPLTAPGQLVSGLAPAPPGLAPTGGTAPAEQPTIPIRRPKRPEPAAAPAATAPAAPTPAPPIPAGPPRPAAPTMAWSASDDDILPGRAAKRRGRRRRG